MGVRVTLTVLPAEPDDQAVDQALAMLQAAYWRGLLRRVEAEYKERQGLNTKRADE